jgi:hypothetical protein
MSFEVPKADLRPHLAQIAQERGLPPDATPEDLVQNMKQHLGSIGTSELSMLPGPSPDAQTATVQISRPLTDMELAQFSAVQGGVEQLKLMTKAELARQLARQLIDAGWVDIHVDGTAVTATIRVVKSGT